MTSYSDKSLTYIQQYNDTLKRIKEIKKEMHDIQLSIWNTTDYGLMNVLHGNSTVLQYELGKLVPMVEALETLILSSVTEDVK